MASGGSDPSGATFVVSGRLLDPWYHSGIVSGMAMTLRLTDGETEALRAQAEIENRSMQDVARAALREYVTRRGNAGLVDKELQYVVTRYAEALQRLGDS